MYKLYNIKFSSKISKSHLKLGFYFLIKIFKVVLYNCFIVKFGLLIYKKSNIY